MDSKTKIVVLHTKELIYTAVFALLCILLIVLLFVMFGPGHTDKKQTAHKQYTPLYFSDHSKCHPAGRRKSRSQQNCGFLHIFDCLLPFHDQIAST